MVHSEGGLLGSTCAMAGCWELIGYPRRLRGSTTTPVSP
jgi:hypothetical protein